MPLKALDVIFIFDKDIDPANWKRVVCICPAEGLFYRINTYDDRPIGVSLPKDPHHAGFLRHDSFIECGLYPLELDEFQIERALEKHSGGPLGRVNRIHAQEINDAVQLHARVDRDLKNLIRSALGC